MLALIATSLHLLGFLSASASEVDIKFLNLLANNDSAAERYIKNSTSLRSELLNMSLRALETSVQTTFSDLADGKSPQNFDFEVSSGLEYNSIVSAQKQSIEVQVLNLKADYGILTVFKYSSGDERNDYVNRMSESLAKLVPINEKIGDFHRRLNLSGYSSRFVGNTHLYRFLIQFIVSGSYTGLDNPEIYEAVRHLIAGMQAHQGVIQSHIIANVRDRLVSMQRDAKVKSDAISMIADALEMKSPASCHERLVRRLDRIGPLGVRRPKL